MQIEKKDDYILDLISKSKNILIIAHNNGNDSLATGISLAKYIEKSYQKSATLIYNGDFSRIDQDLLTYYDVKEDFEPKTLKVTLNYKDTNIETANYYKDEETNEIVMEVKPVDENFDSKRINYRFEGKEYDLIITIGLSRLLDLGQMYISRKNTFENVATTVVNIDNSRTNENFGKINIINPDADSLASLLLAKFSEWKYVPDKEVSKSLLVGILKA